MLKTPNKLTRLDVLQHVAVKGILDWLGRWDLGHQSSLDLVLDLSAEAGCLPELLLQLLLCAGVVHFVCVL